MQLTRLARILIVVLTTIVAFISHPSQPGGLKAQAQANSGVVLDADLIERDSETGVTILRGNVKVIYQQQIIVCDEARIYWKENMVEAWGNLQIQSPTVFIVGERIRLNYQTNTGTIFNGYVRSGQVVFEGRIIQKVGENEYVADQAYYTACITCPPAWSFTGDRIHAELGGYAFIRNSTLRIANFPVFWLPYLVVPLKSERQTGLLVPSIDYGGSGGLAVALPFFWAMNRSQDSTWTLKYFEERGPQGQLEYRYILTPRSSGQFRTALLDDRVFRSQYSEEDSVRWFLDYDHYFDLPEGFTHLLQLNLVSDLAYVRDFPDDILGVKEPALENRISLMHNSSLTHFNITTDYYVDLLQADPKADNENTVHRFPAIQFNLREQNLFDSSLLFRFDASYVNFARQNYSYDDVITEDMILNDPSLDCPPGRRNCIAEEHERDGEFNSDRDLIRSGQRLDLQPTLTYPFNLSPYLRLTPEVSYRYTQYSLGVTVDPDSEFSDSPYRTYLQTRFSGESGLQRIYHADENTAYRHEITSRMSVAAVPYFDQDRHPFFGASSDTPASQQEAALNDSDFLGDRGIQFDYQDRVLDRRNLTFTLENALTRRVSQNAKSIYQRVAFFRLSQSYDLRAYERSEDPRPWSDIRGLLELKFHRFDTNTVFYYYPYHNVTNTSSRFRIRDQNNNFVQISFTERYEIPDDPADLDLDKRNENIGFGLGYNHPYVKAVGTIDYSTTSSEVNSWSLNTQIIPPGNCWSIILFMRQVVSTQDPIYRISFEYNFGGE